MIIAAAAIIRIRAAQNDLWLDEIWSLDFAATISAPLEVFTKIHHDNNHYLTTLWFYFLGPHASSLLYRAPSIVVGVGTVILAGLIGRTRNRTSALFAMTVTTASYVMILYSSEARGQSQGIFCAFLSYYLLDRYLQRPRIENALLFSLSAIVGFLAHLIFLNFYLAAICWSLYHFLRSSKGPRSTISAMMVLHGLPVAFLAVLYFVDIRHIRVGGGTTISLLDASVGFLNWALGPSALDVLRWPIILLTIAVLIVGLFLLWREKSETIVFFIGVIVVFPVALAIMSHIESLYLRHFILGIAFLLILFSFLLEWLFSSGSLGRIVCFVLLAGFFVTNAFPTLVLFQYGRGQYSEAARFMAEHSRRDVVTVGGDDDFRIPLVLQFFAPQAMGNKIGPYYRHDAWPSEGPEWIICHKESFKRPQPPGDSITDQAGNNYFFVQAFPAAPLSGLHWFLYQQPPK